MSDLAKLLAREPFTRFSRRYLGLVSEGHLTPGELVVLLVVADRTVSWRRMWTQLSYTDLVEATGMTRKGLVAVIKRLVAADLVVRKAVGNSYSYALIPVGMTGAEVLAACDVDIVPEGVTSGNQGRIPQVDDLGAGTYIDPKKDLRRGSARVDSGLGSKARASCQDCHGEGWLVTVHADGFTESVSRCPCTG